VAQEGLHSMKVNELKGVVIKIDLSKAYDRVNWLYIDIILTHIGFEVRFINWMMSYISTVSFVVLINETTSPFFHAERGLCHGCALSPLLFLLVVEGLSRAILEAKQAGDFSGIQFFVVLSITHLLFVGNILIFCGGSRRNWENLSNILNLFSRSMGMLVNDQKSSFSHNNLEDHEMVMVEDTCHFQQKGSGDSLKYLGFYLKPSDYKREDWIWLVGKLEKILSVWNLKWLSRADRLVLVKFVLEAIPIYWM